MSPTGLAFLLGFAILFYRVVEEDRDSNRSGILWAGASALAFVAAGYFHTGIIGMLAGQLLVYAALWIANVIRPQGHRY